jgi:hypothetical protein
VSTRYWISLAGSEANNGMGDWLYNFLYRQFTQLARAGGGVNLLLDNKTKGE